MKRTNSEIYHTELLLTLDYLLNYTDEDHPATQQDICRHAKNFGLKYEGGKPGDDVRRQRVGECLQFLQSICYKFEKTDKVPFVINSTPSGKFYIEEKNRLNEEQIIKVLAAIKNDKYTRDEDTDFLVERLLDSLSNKHNRAFFKNELEKASKGVKKYNFATNRKLRLVNKALKEGKMIKIRFEIYKNDASDIDVFDYWYRVYQIKEFRGKPHAILIPISTGKIMFHRSLLFDSIENLNIPNLPDKEVLWEDCEPNRDLEEWFKQRNSADANFYGSIEKLIETNVMPVGSFPHYVSFYFNINLANFIKQSFEEFFSKEFEYTKCASFDILEEKMNENEPVIVPHKLKEGEKPIYGVANIILNKNAFQSWLISDPHGEGYINISNMVHIVSPNYVNKNLAFYYKNNLLRYKEYLNEKSKQSLFEELSEKK